VYVSVLYRKKNDVLTGVEKMTVVLCYILGAMVVNAAFYQNQQNTIVAYISVAIISSAVIIPAKVLLRELFGFSGAPFEEKRTKFRQQYRKIIAQKIAVDLSNDRMPLEQMDKKLGLLNPSEEEREERLRRQEEYCELLMNDAHAVWERAAYTDIEKKSIEEMTDAEILALKQQVADEQAKMKKVNIAAKHVASTAPTTLNELDQVNALETLIAEDMATDAIAARERKAKFMHDNPHATQAEVDQSERIERTFEEREHQIRIAKELKAKKKKKFRCPACCKTAMMIVAIFWCTAASAVMLIYGIKFDLSAEEVRYAQTEFCCLGPVMVDVLMVIASCPCACLSLSV
jgi:hypothetical protein